MVTLKLMRSSLRQILGGYLREICQLRCLRLSLNSVHKKILKFEDSEALRMEFTQLWLISVQVLGSNAMIKLQA